MKNILTKQESAILTCKSMRLFNSFMVHFAVIIIPLALFSCDDSKEKDTTQSLLDRYGEFSSLYPVQYGDRWGYINAKGELKISPIFEMDADGFNNFFVNGLAIVSTDGDKYGFIDEKGNFVIQPQYDEAVSFGVDGLAWVRSGSNSHFIDRKGMPKILLSNYKFTDYFFSDGLTYVRDDRYNYGYINTEGKLVIPPVFYDGNSFSNGLAWVKRTRDSKFEAIDKTGKTVIPAMFDYASDFTEGLASVRVGNYYGYVNTSGEFQVPLQYDWAGTFYEGLACAESNGRYGYIDKMGEWVIMPQFNEANEFCGGLAGASIGDEKWGFIDKKGNWVVQPIFEYAVLFIGDLGIVFIDQDDEGFSYVNKNGQIIWHHSNRQNVKMPAPRPTREMQSMLRKRIYQQFNL
jgi:hypothetical protein